MRIGGRLALVAGFLLLATTGASAQSVAWDQPAPSAALLPVRNFQPVQLLFPGPRHAPASALSAGSWSVAVELSESNTLNVSQNDVTGTGIELDLEATRVAIRLRRGLGGGWELGAEVPYVARWGGVLDRPIEIVERSVNQLNPTRDERARGLTRLRYERRGRSVFSASGPRAGLGDVGLFVHRSFEPVGGEGRWALRGGVELATGDEEQLFGSGGTDAWLGAVYSRPLGRGRLTGNLNLVFPEAVWEGSGVETSGFATAALGWACPWRPRTSLSVQLGYYQSPFEQTGTDELELDLWDLSASARFRLEGGWSWQIGGVQNLVYQSGADFSLLTRLVWTSR
jgi:hypothetical protein